MGAMFSSEKTRFNLPRGPPSLGPVDTERSSSSAGQGEKRDPETRESGSFRRDPGNISIAVSVAHYCGLTTWGEKQRPDSPGKAVHIS